MNQMTEELADAFSGNDIGDFIIADFLSLNETTPKENLVVQENGPFVSFVTRADLEKNTEPSFAGDHQSSYFSQPQRQDIRTFSLNLVIYCYRCIKLMRLWIIAGIRRNKCIRQLQVLV